MKTNYFLIFFIVVILITVVFSIWYFSIIYSNYSKLKQSQTPVMSEIRIDNKVLADVVKKSRILNAAGNRVIEENKDYQIIYLVKEKSFYINILSKQFDEAKKRVEDRFLEMTGLTVKRVCLLGVVIGTPPLINQDYAGKEYSLRFCEK